MTSPGDQHRPDDGGRVHPERPGPSHGRLPPYGSTPYGGAPHEPAPPGAAGTPPYVYNPYGNVSYPATYPSVPDVPGDPARRPARRPGSMHLALALFVLSALPYVLMGLFARLQAVTLVGSFPPETRAQLEADGQDPVQLLQTAGTVLTTVALAFVLLAVLAWTGRRWARGLVAATTVGFGFVLASVLVLVLGASAGGAAVNGASLVLLVLPVALAAGGVGLMFGAAAREWFRNRG